MKKLWIAGICLLGCTHGQEVLPSRDVEGMVRLSEGIRPKRQGNERETHYDLNHDGKPDVWDYTITSVGPDGKESEHLARKELDLNFDGKVDLVRFYNEKGEIEKELFDLDFDGKVDQANYYESNRLVRKER